MKKLFAVPTVNGKLTAHFGRCEQFAIVETEDNKILSTTFFDPPEHQPGTYPKFLAEQGVSVILSGGMGGQAQNLFANNNIEVRMGVRHDNPEDLVKDYFKDLLESGDNPCDHGEGDCNH